MRLVTPDLGSLHYLQPFARFFTTSALVLDFLGAIWRGERRRMAEGGNDGIFDQENEATAARIVK